VTLLTERRRHAPYGLAGGEQGARGENWLIPGDGSQPQRLPGKTAIHARAGDRIGIATPGGGGWGKDK
ncbi:MAG TPA: hydantoinase B/oxoprolinase family protein, partial [Anaerolineae bacterium]|nr:hydantoinase B/oxoprolinase family protein [Anaerolineae bacterium]